MAGYLLLYSTNKLHPWLDFEAVSKGEKPKRTPLLYWRMILQDKTEEWQNHFYVTDLLKHVENDISELNTHHFSFP